MVWERLKKARVILSLLLLCATAFVFLFPALVPARQVSDALSAFQIIPALLKNMSGWGAWSLGVVGVVVLTIMVGRIYCSVLCPLGVVQDIVIALSRRNRKRRWFRFREPDYLFHYAVLAVTLAGFTGGSLVLLNLLEPFSNVGRVLETFIRPILIGVNNGGAWILGLLDLYAVAAQPLHPAPIGVILGGALFVAGVGYLSFYHGRLFCNSLCPAGAVLGLLARAAAFRIVIDRETCTHCKLCEKVCKAMCIDSEAQRVEFSACIGCMNCMKACPTVGMRYEGLAARMKAGRESPVSVSRRTFLAGSMSSAAGILLAGQDSAATAKEPPPQTAVTPPGSLSVEHFTERCTACHLCVSVCPPQVLRPALLEYGIAGIMQPRMDYATAYCTYDCVLCTSVCPSGALTNLSVEQKKEVQLGKAFLIKDECIVVAKKTDCGACSEHCPTKAVTMVPYEKKLMIPELNNDICIGCGACEHTCPTRPRRAIYVVANAVHLKAKKPEIKKLEEPQGGVQDFPF